MIKNVSLIICLGDLDLTKPKQLTITQTVMDKRVKSNNNTAILHGLKGMMWITILLILIVWQSMLFYLLPFSIYKS